MFITAIVPTIRQLQKMSGCQAVLRLAVAVADPCVQKNLVFKKKRPPLWFVIFTRKGVDYD